MAVSSRIKDVAYSVARLSTPRNAGVILMYHSISEAKHFAAVTPENFEKQMEALKDDGFNVVSLDRLAEYRKNGTIPRKTVCLTFDDGYRDNYTVAFPILKRIGFPATVFVITGAIGGTWETRGEIFDMLSQKEIEDLSASGLIAIEPHTVSHPKLHRVDAEQAEEEIRISKTRLESLTGRPCVHFAYPRGRHNDIAEAAAARAGIEYAYTVREGFARPEDDDFTLHRNGINRTITIPQFRGIALWGRLSRARLLGLKGI